MAAGDKHALKRHAQRLNAQLGDLVAMVRGDLRPLERKKVNTLVITDVHGRDIVDGFVRDSVLDAREFAWESQLRFAWDRGMVRGPGRGVRAAVAPAARVRSAPPPWFESQGAAVMRERRLWPLVNTHVRPS